MARTSKSHPAQPTARAEAHFTTPLRLVSPEWLDSWAERTAHGHYGGVDVRVRHQVTPDIGETLLLDVELPSGKGESIEIQPHELVPLWFALQGAIAAGQTTGMLPVESPRDGVLRQLAAHGYEPVPAAGEG